ncbi:hypothetical protein Tco_0746302 [Tanacetum coccineum]
MLEAFLTCFKLGSSFDFLIDSWLVVCFNSFGSLRASSQQKSIFASVPCLYIHQSFFKELHWQLVILLYVSFLYSFPLFLYFPSNLFITFKNCLTFSPALVEVVCLVHGRWSAYGRWSGCTLEPGMCRRVRLSARALEFASPWWVNVEGYALWCLDEGLGAS